MKKFDEIKKNIDCNWKKLLENNPEIHRKQAEDRINVKYNEAHSTIPLINSKQEGNKNHLNGTKFVGPLTTRPKKSKVGPKQLHAKPERHRETEDDRKRVKFDVPKYLEAHPEIHEKPEKVGKRNQKRVKLEVPKPPENDKEKNNPEIWFDDVDEIYLERKPTSLDPSVSSAENPLVKAGAFDGLTRVVAMDCEMVGVGDDGEDSILARVSIVNHFGMCVYDKFVKPTEEVTDYRTAVSGIRPSDVRNGEEFKMVQKEVSDILRNRILVGHAIQNDLKVLFLPHPRKNIRDTSRYKPFRKLFNGRNPSLKNLSEQLLGVKVQTGEHNSVQDAQAAMRLYTMHLKRWEGELKNQRKGKRTEAVPKLS